MTELRSKYYRVSIKALVLNETRDKFLLLKQSNGVYDLPGGGMDWGETPHETLTREISEEMGITPTWIADRPSYFLGGFQVAEGSNVWVVNLVYEARLPHLNFTPSDECQEITFVSLQDLQHLAQIPPTVKSLAIQFTPENH